MVPGRRLPATANTSVLRVTPHHTGLLEEWRSLLRSTEYQSAQLRPWDERPTHLMGDQDVLTALLSSADFADVPVRMLRRDVDIAHCFGSAGYLPLQRVRAVVRGQRLPPLVHAQGGQALGASSRAGVIAEW